MTLIFKTNEMSSNEHPLPDHIQVILNAFDFLEGPFPRQAILDAREHRDEIIPELLNVFSKEIDTPDDQRQFHTWRPTIALFLLVEFRVKEALPLVLRSLHFSEEATEEIYGDLLTEDLAGILYHLGVEVNALDSIICDKKIDSFIRWEAIHCFYYFVRDGRMNKEELIDRLQARLREAIDLDDAEMCTSLATELADCGAESTLPVIKQAYDKDLIDTFFLGKWHDLEKHVRTEKPAIEKKLKELDDYSDVVEVMSDWPSFQPKKPEPRIHAPLRGNPKVSSPKTSHELAKPKIGRNDPCPCGSGKKYKKCCMK